MKLKKWTILINSAVFNHTAITSAQCRKLPQGSFVVHCFRNFWCNDFNCQSPEELINPVSKNDKVSKNTINRITMETITGFSNLNTCLPLAER
jgi:hypothetical protein